MSLQRMYQKNQALISLVIIIMDSDDNKVNIDWFYLKKSSLTQSEEINSCIYLLNLSTSIVLVATVFFSQFSDPLSSRPSFYFILSSFFYLHPSRVDQIDGVDHCLTNIFLKYLVLAIRLKLLFKYRFLIDKARKLATEHLMRWQQLSLKYFIAFLCPVLS